MSDRLAIYLNDHLAGSTAGVALAKRLRGSNADDPDFGTPLARVCAEIEADRETLLEVMDRLDVGRDPLKPLAALVAEHLGRLKLNGQLRGYSPLSRLTELEALQIGVAGKRRLWKVLDHIDRDELANFDFDQLAGRADSQQRTLEELHLKASELAF